MSWLLSLISWFVSKLFGKPAGPSQEAVQASAAAQAEQALSEQEKALANVSKARAASDVAILRSITQPSSLRDPSPDSRD